MTNTETSNNKAASAKAQNQAAAIGAYGEAAGQLLSSCVAKSGDALTATAFELLQCQREIADAMASNWRKRITSSHGNMPGYANMTNYLHDQNESLVTNLRKMVDSVRDCGW